MVYVHFTCWELFFIYLKHLPAKLYFPTNTHLGRKYPFSLCWGKRTFYCEKHISDKTSITKDIRHSCICLLHMLSLTRLFFTIHFYFTMQCLWAWISRTETVGVTFSQYSPACKKEPADSHPNFCSWANDTFFCQHAQDQYVILMRTHFAVPALNTMSEKNNFNFLLYNLPHD